MVELTEAARRSIDSRRDAGATLVRSAEKRVGKLLGKSQNYLVPIQHVFEFVVRVLRLLGERKVKISSNRRCKGTLVQAFFVEFCFHDFTISACTASLAAWGTTPEPQSAYKRPGVH